MYNGQNMRQPMLKSIKILNHTVVKNIPCHSSKKKYIVTVIRHTSGLLLLHHRQFRYLRINLWLRMYSSSMVVQLEAAT